MIKPLLHTWNLNLDYAKRLVADLGPDKWAYQPAPKTNHAAWVIGHLAASADLAGTLIGLSNPSPKEWEELYGWDSSPKPDAKLYAPRAALVKALEDGHARI